ncbi:N-acetylmuramoyl-L-alanine amidase [Leptothoe sp. PORK10 BA2]|uniref:N-acetylmuramoyl-L-alanine amidase n=1 Tax=Leptothoe sp. PORK10 BA2 TaxID=3110254 RepID=UPI002B20752C|nr:N-acetylmuramoyl-L-alanine amidase [Leptothoe sp. PORK10 BA2]MEA5465159.1 N-acetylmuramoyl-L-alanine amidase [Leptothoe sp. PORK10 BA2]
MSRLTAGVVGIVGAALIALPAEAANLQFWRFDQQENRLTFTTDTQVQPRAQLIFNPTRLVIDLPDTQVTSSTTRQRLQAGLQEVRVGQLDAQTARIVIELAPGYTLDPQQVQVRGETNRRWFVQLPDLIADDGSIAANTDRSEQTAQATNQSTNQVTDDNNGASNLSDTATQVQSIVATADGFFIRVAGKAPEIRLRRSRRRDPERKIIFELPNSSIAPNLTPEALPNNRYSIETWEVSQTDSSVLIAITLGDDSPDWRAIVTDISPNFRGIAVLPDGVAIRDIPDSGAPRDTVPAPADPITIRPPGDNLPPRELPRRPSSVEEPSDSNALPQVPQGRIVVALDPGHGGRDPGAVGIGGLQEKQVIFPISQQVASILREQGVEVVMTRNSDIEVDLDPRVQVAERANADLFVSLHANAISLSRPDVNGLETYYYSDAGARFARTVHDTVLRTMGMSDRQVRQARFYVIRQTSMPAILIEVGFVTGAEDIHNLRDPEWRSRMANAIAQGILTHIQREF